MSKLGLIEHDPRDTAYVALFVAIKWYEFIPSEAALKIAAGQSHRLPGKKLTPEMFTEMQKIMDSPNFYNINSFVKKYRVNKYEILEAIAGQNANEEVIMSIQTERLLKRLKDLAEDCKAVDCEKCPLDKIMCGEYTLCEVLTDTAIDGKGKLELRKVIPKSYQSHTVEDLEADIVRKTYKLHKKADDEMHTYAEKHPREKIQDIVSLALLEYVERRK